MNSSYTVASKDSNIYEDDLESDQLYTIAITPEIRGTISKKWFDILFIIGIMFVASIAILIAILSLYYSVQQEPITTKPVTKLRTKPIQKPPFYPYKEVGTLNDEKIQISIVDQFFATKDQCKQACDRESRCHSFIQNDNWCTLLTDNIHIRDTIYNTSEPSFYTKNPDTIIFDGRILLARNNVAVPSKYWLNTDPDRSLFFSRNEVVKLDFYPRYIKLNQPDTGIYCSFPFELSDIPTLMKSNLCYIHAPNDDLDVFPDFKGKPIYVAYISVKK